MRDRTCYLLLWISELEYEETNAIRDIKILVKRGRFITIVIVID